MGYELLSYETLGLEDINLGYAGRFSEGSNIHGALARLQPGARLSLRALEKDRIGIIDDSGVCVARLSRKGEAKWSKKLKTIREVRVLAMVARTAAQDDEPARRERYRVQEWEVPMLEVVCQALGAGRSFEET